MAIHFCSLTTCRPLPLFRRSRDSVAARGRIEDSGEFENFVLLERMADNKSKVLTMGLRDQSEKNLHVL